MTTPTWVQDAIFYQIFPDRFANGDPGNDPPNLRPWDALPTTEDFQGGDLKGILKRFDYLLDLGITAIYLNPIFLSTTTHHYDTSDYYSIDPRLGTMADFRTLLDTAHRNGVRLILDGVFNHCGRGFFAFVDVLKNEEDSAYRNWFHIKRFPIDAYGPGEAESYLGWWKHKSLPKFNTNNPQVRQYIYDVARYWIEQGIDGWRLDVPGEIDDDSFWEQFRHVVKSANPEAYLVGEIWTPEPRWANDQHFDGLMNYPWREALLELLNEGAFAMPRFTEKIEKLLHIYSRENTYAMYLPLGSHDTERLITSLAGNIEKVKLAFLFQMAFPGAPATYYGDEIGLEGDKDPDCRRTFPWGEGQWQGELRNWVKTLISLRKKHPALRRGDFLRLPVDESRGLYCFARTLTDERIVVAINASEQEQQVDIPIAELEWHGQEVFQDLIGYMKYKVDLGKLSISLPPWGGAYFVQVSNH